MTTQDLKYTPEDTSGFGGVIYYLHNGDHIPRYIGQTQKPLKKRFSMHLSTARGGSPIAVSCWIRKHGTGNIRACVLATVAKDEVHLLDDLEIFHIAQYRDIIEEKNLNLQDGGEGQTVGFRHSEESKRKMSESQRKLNRRLTPEHIQILSETHKGKVVSVETRAKLSAPKVGKPIPHLEGYWVGRKQTPESNKKRAEAMEGRPTEPAFKVGNHTRWHINKGIFKEGCSWCDEEASIVLMLT